MDILRLDRRELLAAHLQLTEEDDAVCPQNHDLLNITYKARALEEYEDESE